MKNRYIPAFVMLVAGLISCLFSIVHQWDVTYSLILLFFVLIIFYCIGKIAARIISKMQAENLEQRRQRELEEQEALQAKEALEAAQATDIEDGLSEEEE